MSKLLLFLVLIFNSVILIGQDTLPNKLAFNVGYYGETVTHQGANVGIEYYPFQNDKFQIILASNIGGYVHKRNNTSLFIRQQWGQRVTFSNGLFVDEFLGLGYLRNFTHGGDSYSVLPNGAVVENKNNGQSMVMPSVAIGTGYDFSKKTKCRLVFYIRPEFFWKAPFNGYYLTHFAVNTGLLFHLK